MTRRLLAVAVLLLAVAGCSVFESGRDSVPAADLFDKVLELKQSGRSAPLASLTDFSWDGVYCYNEGAENDRINSDAGGRVEEPGRRLAVSGALAVFVKDGRPVRKAVIPELNFELKRYSAAVVVDSNTLHEPAA